MTTVAKRFASDAAGRLRDGQELHVPGPGFLTKWLTGKLDQTEIGELLRQTGLVPGKQ